MSIHSGTRSASAGMLTRRPLKGATLLAAAVAVGLATWAGPATADSDTPSLEEMWQIIQNQQDEIDRLKIQNTQLREKVETPPPAPAVAPVAEAAPVPQGDGSGTRIDVYGAAMLDMATSSTRAIPTGSMWCGRPSFRLTPTNSAMTVNSSPACGRAASA